MKYFLLSCLYSLKRIWAIIKPTRIRWARLHPEGKQPFRAYPTDSGFDVHAVEELSIPKGAHLNCGTGIAVEVESGWGYSLRGRSGLNKKGIIAALGLVDSYYNNEIRVVLSNLSEGDFKIHPGDRIAQIHLHPVFDVPWEEVKVFKSRPGTRGLNGWGSSGGYQK